MADQSERQEEVGVHAVEVRELESLVQLLQSRLPLAVPVRVAGPVTVQPPGDVGRHVSHRLHRVRPVQPEPLVFYNNIRIIQYCFRPSKT